MDNIEGLLEEFSHHGVCSTGQRWLRGQKKDMDTLVHVWRRWPEYLFEHYDFAINLLRNMLSEDDIEKLASKKLFVDKNAEIEACAEEEPIFVVGKSNVTIHFSSYGTSRIYCYGECTLRVIGDSTTITMIDACNHSIVIVEGSIHPTVFAYDESNVEGNAKVVRKNKERGNVFNGKVLRDYDTRSW